MLAILAIGAILLFFFAPVILHHPPRGKADRIKCVKNLKHIGLAYRIFATDNNDRLPWTPETNSFGVRENPATNAILTHILPATNELSAPMILYCPADSRRKRATSWASLIPKENMSYFLGVSSSVWSPHSITGGDSNLLVDGQPIRSGLVAVRNGEKLVFNADRHKSAGNFLMGDGSVQMLSNSRLSELLSAQTNEIVLVTP